MTALRVTGLMAQEHNLTLQEFQNVDPTYQVADISTLMAGRDGQAITLQGLLEICKPLPEAQYLGLHGNRGLIQYAKQGLALDVGAGGPYRFLIPDHAACNTDDIDECANVKFLDHIEFTAERGFDNRPEDEDEHAALHERENHTHH